MSNPTSFMNQYVASIVNLIAALNQAQYMNSVLADDSTLPTRYFASTQPPPRTDITAQDVTNASSAIAQLLFTFNSGTPTQASLLYKMLP